MGTGRMNSARPFRRAVNDVTPKRRANHVGTGARTVTPRTLLLTTSGAAVTGTPATPSVKPFFAASVLAAVTAPPTLVGRKTTPASAAACAARCTRGRARPDPPRSRPRTAEHQSHASQ